MPLSFSPTPKATGLFQIPSILNTVRKSPFGGTDIILLGLTTGFPRINVGVRQSPNAYTD